MAPIQHILFVDAFDSFTNNIVGLLEQNLRVQVTVVHIDDVDVARNLEVVVRAFDAVVVGPGPGHPAIPRDIGFINKLWTLQDADIVPILGVCLGFQSLAAHHGAEVRKLRRARHGIVSRVLHSGTDIFENLGHLYTTQYHSLHIDLGEAWQDGSQIGSPNWIPTKLCSSLRPLAWDLNDELNGPVLMAIKHTEKPFWGVQFHPESICTSKEGTEMIQNWWMHANSWSLSQHRMVAKDRSVALRYLSVPPSITNTFNKPDKLNASSHRLSHLTQELQSITGIEKVPLQWAKHSTSTGYTTPVALCEALGLNRDELVMLDSQGHTSGRFSILGIVVPGQTMKVTYRVSDRTLRYGFRSSDEFAMQLESIDQIWPIFQEVLDLFNPMNQQASSDLLDATNRRGRRGFDQFVDGHLPMDCPFWGGFVGYISYEAGLETIQVDLHESCSTSDVPDVNFAFVHRSIVIDHETSQIYVQSLLPNDWTWILGVGRTIDGLVITAELSGSEASRPASLSAKKLCRTPSESLEEADLEKRLRLARMVKPEQRQYYSKVLDCQESLSAGNSYELCLTDEAVIKVPRVDGKPLDPWSLYKKLRRKNPAPFGAFLRLTSSVVVGSSPERFLQWNRSGHCQFRPIKGTVKKSATMTRERAHGILNSSKERAENLMIVDLIRHDLSGVVGAENCKVSKLMVIEEYETVYQLVSVIEGQLPKSSNKASPRGIDVLKASLPPGSMTGAPKKRSCEILRDIEQRSRGIYSGVLGYMDIGGAGDFSVVIRTAVRGKNSVTDGRINGKTNGHTNGHVDVWRKGHAKGSFEVADTWRVGAGGAITIQSTAEAEFLEMEVKASSVLTSFQQDKT